MSFTVEFAPGAGPFDVIGDHYLQTDGSSLSFVLTPDAASLDITGDIDVRVDVELDWKQPGPNGQALAGKWNATGNQRSWVFWVWAGTLQFAWSTAGTDATSLAADGVAVPWSTGRHIVRVTLDVNDGSGNRVATFYEGDSITGPWTQIGDTQTQSGTTSIFSSSSDQFVAHIALPDLAQNAVGKFHQAQVRSGIDGSIVANPDFSAQAVGALSFADSTGKTWTVQTGADIAGFDWVTLPDRLLEAAWSEGRDDELEHYGPGEATLVLRNDDRLFDPDHAGGTYFGELLPRTPFRLREDGEDRFYGFVDSGFEQGYLPPSTATCTVKLTDRLSVVAGLLSDVFEHSILSGAPIGFWVLDGPSGTEQVADLSGNGHDGAVVGGVAFGDPPLASGHGTSARFDAAASAADVATFGRVELSRSAVIPDPSTCAVVATFKSRTAGVENFRMLFVQSDGNAASGTSTGVEVLVDLGSDLHFVWTVGGGGADYEWPDVVDGAGHIMFGQSDGIAVDTATLSTTTGLTPPPLTNGVGIGGYPGVQAVDHFDGWIGAVAAFDRTLLEQERQTIVDGYTKLAGQRSDQHIAWALDRLGVPAEHRNLDEGTVLMGPADTAGRDALDWIREVVATEQGEFYVDHRDGGKLRFRHRYARFVDARSTVSQATFSDLVSGVGIQLGGLDVAPNGIDGIVNQASVKWRDGEVSVQDSGSVSSFGPQGRTVTTQATTGSQARSTGEWLVARYKDPRSRVRGITTRPDASANALAAAQDLEVGDRVSYRFHPQQVGAATELDLFVEGIDHEISEGTVRVASYHLAPVNTFTPWIWGTSEWDNDTFWG